MTESYDRARELLIDVLARSEAAERQVTLGGGRLHVLRVANNRIQESVEERWSLLGLQLAFPWRDAWRVGRSETTDTSLDSRDALIEATRVQAMDTAPTPEYEPLPDLWDFESIPTDSSAAYDSRTALAGPARLAHELSQVTLPALARGYSTSGHLAVGVGTLRADGDPGLAALANSNDIFQFYLPTHVRLSARIGTPRGGAAYVEADGHGLAELDLVARTERAIRIAELPLLDAPPAAGPRRVLLEPPAVAQLLDLLAAHFSYSRVARGLSGLAGLEGTQAFAASVSIDADPTHPRLLGRPFDVEGWPSRPIRLVEAGVPSAWVYTRTEARAAGATPSGYARSGLGGALEAVPRSLVMAGEGRTPDDLLVAADNCLIFQHFNEIHWSGTGTLVLEGRAADEVLQVVGGRMAGLLPGFAFTMDVGALLAHIVALGEPVRARGHLVPALVADGIEVSA